MVRARGLAALRGVLGSPEAQHFLELIELLAAGRPDPAAVAEAFGRLWEELTLEPELLLPDAWRSHLVCRLLDDENPFTTSAKRGEMGPTLAEQARRDLRTLRELFDLDGATLLGMVEDAVPGSSGAWVPWRSPGRAGGESPRHAIARKLAAAEDWGDCTELLADHYARHGAGRFGRYRAFRWREDVLRAVAEPDPLRLVELVG